MAKIPINKYPNQAGYTQFDTERNIIETMSDGIFKSMSTPEGWINVKDFGAKGDNITDDTQAIQNSINQANDGSVIYIPNGNYKLTDTIHVNKPITIFGEHKYNTSFQTDYTTEQKAAIQIESGYVNLFNFALRNNTLSMTHKNYGILLSNPDKRLAYININHIYIYKYAFAIYTQYSDGWFYDINIKNIHILHTLVGLKIGALMTAYASEYPVLSTYPIKYFAIDTDENEVNNIFLDTIAIYGHTTHLNQGTIGFYLQRGNAMRLNNISLNDLSHGIVIGAYNAGSSGANIRSEGLANALGIYEDLGSYFAVKVSFPITFADYGWGTRPRNYYPLSFSQSYESIDTPVRTFYMKSPDGSIYKISIDDNGNLTTTLQD